MDARNLPQQNSDFKTPRYSIGPVIEMACCVCRRIRSREDCLEAYLEDGRFGRVKFVCAECCQRFDDADRVADEVLAMLEAEELGGAATPAARLKQARAYVASGLSLIPIGAGSKSPPIPWKEYQARKPTDKELSQWVDHYPGIGIVCGEFSGNLEVLDLEADAPLKEFHRLVEKRAPDMLARFPRVRTPTGGRHLPYRCDVIEGNQKLAADANGKTLIETRGTGGQVLSPLCLPETHPSGKPYKLLAGDLTNIPTITPDEREILFSVARSFNEHIEPKKAKGFREASQGNGTRPGEDFNNRPDVLGQVQSLLRECGWSKFGNGRAGELWSRPGVSDHSSATLYDSGYLYVFSSNALPFSAGEAYSPFAIYAELKHSGDFSAAAKDLAGLGFGQSNGHKPTMNSGLERRSIREAARVASFQAYNSG